MGTTETRTGWRRLWILGRLHRCGQARFVKVARRQFRRASDARKALWSCVPRLFSQTSSRSPVCHSKGRSRTEVRQDHRRAGGDDGESNEWQPLCSRAAVAC